MGVGQDSDQHLPNLVEAFIEDGFLPSEGVRPRHVTESVRFGSIFALRGNSHPIDHSDFRLF